MLARPTERKSRAAFLLLRLLFEKSDTSLGSRSFIHIRRRRRRSECIHFFFVAFCCPFLISLRSVFFLLVQQHPRVRKILHFHSLFLSLSLDAARHKNIPSKLERVYTAVKKKKEENTISRDITTIAARVNQDSAVVAFTISRRPSALPTGHAISFDYFYY